MWVLAFFLVCVALFLIAKFLQPKDGLTPQQASKDVAPQESTQETQDQLTDLKRTMTPFSLNVTPKPESMSDAVMVDGDGQVQISIEHQTCTCQKFADRANRPMDNISRWCRHLAHIMDARRALEHENEWIKAIIADGYDGPLYAFIIDRPTTGQILMTGIANSEWINFYARSKRSGETVAQASGKIKRYGWSMARKGWAYGNPPPGARELRALIQPVNGINIEE